jgi:hypothetical protein
VRWSNDHREPYDPRFRDVETIENDSGNYIFAALFTGDLPQATEHMKTLHNFIQKTGFVCEDPQAMEALSAAIEEVVSGHPEMAIQLMRQFYNGVIVALHQPSDTEFARYRNLVMERHQQPTLHELLLESEPLQAVIVPAAVVDDFMYGGRQERPGLGEDEPPFELVTGETLYNELWN